MSMKEVEKKAALALSSETVLGAGQSTAYPTRGWDSGTDIPS